MGYTFVRSAPVVPLHDKDLLFVSAGVNQFKPFILPSSDGTCQSAPFKTAVNSQKCIRISGKHNDLEAVGKDGFHHTFFEMLGNWSFNGHIPKETVCQQAWELLTRVYKLPTSRLFVTYFAGDRVLKLDADQECRDLWLRIGLPCSHVLPCGMQDNFWDMGEKGPCGPCTEIYYSSDGNPSTGTAFELWNIVFMQYNRLSTTEFEPLPFMHVDTGMGLERLCTVMQNVRSNYDTDIFKPLLESVHRFANAPSYSGKFDADKTSAIDGAYRIIVDHARMCVVAIADGVVPGANKAGYVLRKIIRRMLFYSQKLGCSEGFLDDLVSNVIQSLGPAYPEVEACRASIMTILLREQRQLSKAQSMANSVFQKLLARKGALNIQTKDVFLLYNTFGLPREAIAQLTSDASVSVQWQEFNELFEKQRQDSVPKRASSRRLKRNSAYTDPVL